jgi:hypothetical protein
MNPVKTIFRWACGNSQAPAAPTQVGIPPSKEEIKGRRGYYVHGLEDIRKLLQRAGAALGVAATALLAGLGYAQLHNLFPLPSTDDARWSVAVVAGVSALAAAGGSIWLASRFFGAQRRILISPSVVSDPNARERRGFTDDELGGVRAVYERYVERYAPGGTDPANLARVQERADALRNSGDEDLAERLDGVVDIAQLDAVTEVLEYRSNRAFRGWKSGSAVALALGGIIGLFAVADYSKSKRPTSDQQMAQLNQTKANTALTCEKLQTPPPGVCPKTTP